MIVNTAYMYMGKISAPANPVIFDKQVYNYQYVANGVAANGNGFWFNKNGDITFINMDLTDFSSVTVTAVHNGRLSQTLRISILKADGTESPSTDLTYSSGSIAGTKTWAIPDGYKLKNAKLKLQAIIDHVEVHVNAISAILS